MAEAKQKSRVSYPPEMRTLAKDTQRGLVTVSILMPNGEKIEHQGAVDIQQLMFIKWAMAITFCEEVRQLPDLEATIRQLMEK